jgi:NitT/TauT family transport system substrate-binding protein
MGGGGMKINQSRRGFLAGLSASGAAGLLGSRPASAEGAQLETTSVRLASAPGICIAPQYVAEALLRADGFDEVIYVPVQAGLSATEQTARGEIDLQIEFATAYVLSIDAGAPIKVLSGVHVGCYELFAHPSIRSILDLKGKSVGAGYNLGSDPHIFVSAMATYVGLDPTRDINWVTSEEESLDLFKQGKIDAFLSFPPEAQKLRAEGVGHVIVNSMQDDPWSQYFCCMLAGNADFVARNPVATKRVVRAILKSADICISEPERAARLLVDKGYATEYEFALQALREIPFAPWRDYEPEDTVRFFALRLHESGLIKSNPQQIIADGTDWTMLNEIRRELKA